MVRWLGLRGTGEHVPVLQFVVRELLVRIADRRRLFLVRGMHDPYERINHGAFMRGTAWAMHLDYVTHAATEMIAREITARGVPGAIAELGVGTAMWARTANRVLPDRPLHLLDTFEGFDARDLSADAAVGLSADAPYEMTGVDIEWVRQALPNPESAVFHVGWFPGSATDLGDTSFALVHIDVGTRSATLAGLTFFGPRMAPGGTLIVEDYNNRHAPGVRMSVDEYLREHPTVTTVWPNVGGAILLLSPPAPATPE